MMRRGKLMSIFVGGRLLRCAAAPACKARSAAVNDDALLPGPPLLLPCCCGLVSRSRGLHCPSELERVLSSMEKATIETAQVIGISELGKMGIAKRTSDVARYIVRCPGTVTGLRCEMLDIYWRDRCVTFFSAAGKDLLVAVAVPHDIPTDAETNGIKRVHTLSLLDGDVTAHVEPLHQVYEVYCAENGVDKLRSDNSSFENNLKDFVLKTLMLHQKQNLGAVTPHLALSPTYFVANRILKVDGRHRCLAAENRDWRMLTHRFIDYRHGKGQFCSDLVDLKLPQTWAIDANVAVLIGGESGSGKTMEMICGHCDKSDLVIYVRGFPGEDGVVDDIHSAFYYSSPLMEDVLKRHTSGETFTVRLCFDDIDDSPAFVSVCSMDIKKLRGKLGWGPLVEIRVTAAPRRIVAASNVSGITSNLYQLAQLTRNEPTRNAASVYWEIRRHLSNELMQARSGGRAADFDELLSDVEILEKHWGDRQQREALLRKRSATLSRLLRKLAGTTAPCSVSTPLKVTEPVHTLLMQEALFAAVESDGTCAAALANPRMAALLVNEVLDIARQTSADEIISVATREVNVRRHVLQRAARGFKVISERDYTFREVTPQLVESLRHVLFDGYTSAETHCYNTHVLVAHQAILNDNVVYERDVTKGYAVVDDDGKPRTMTIKSRASKSGVTLTACYPKDLGRYSISPAMMVILTTSVAMNTLGKAVEQNERMLDELGAKLNDAPVISILYASHSCWNDDVFEENFTSPTHSAHMLVTSRGILIDNAKYERDVPKDCAVVLGDDGTPRTMTMSIKDYTFREVTPQLVESLRHVLFDGYTSAETHYYNTHVLVARRAILNDNVVYERDVPKGYAVVDDDGKPRTMTIKSRELSKSGVVYTACYPKDVGRYSISPAMMVILTTLMSGVFEENFTNTNNGFEHSMAKFLYLAVQVFHGRPVRELVNFVAGPSAIVGKAAQKILDSSTTINFIALTLRMGENKSQARGAEESIQVQGIPAPKVLEDEELAKSVASKLSPEDDPGEACVCKPLVDEALAKSVASKLSPEDDPGEACVCKPLYRQDNNPEVKKCSLCAWIECSPTWLPSADVVLHIPKVVTITIQHIKTFPSKIECRNVPGSLKAMRSPAADIYNERLQKLGAPVIAILCASDDALMTGKRAGWGRADSSHCIVMANGAGENIRSNESMSEVGDATHDDNAAMNRKRLHCAKD
ncbi:Hypothetical protein, putative, partial [Bodo saltans]